MSEDQKPKTPSFFASQVNEGKDGKSHFNRIGAAFEHADGEGHTVLLDSVPLDGRIVLRTPQERLDDMRSNGGGDTRQRGNNGSQRGERRQPDPSPEYDR